MNVQRWDGSSVQKMNPTLMEFMAAVNDPAAKCVSIHNCPPIGSVIQGRIVDEENRDHLYLDGKARWAWATQKVTT